MMPMEAKYAASDASAVTTEELVMSLPPPAEKPAECAGFFLWREKPAECAGLAHPSPGSDDEIEHREGHFKARWQRREGLLAPTSIGVPHLDGTRTKRTHAAVTALGRSCATVS